MRRTYIKFCVLQAMYWSFYASLPAYIAAYMLSLGMSAGTLGVLLALNMGLSFMGSLFWGRWVDRRQASRRYFLIGIAASAALGLMLFFAAGTPGALFVLYPAFGFMMGPIATTLDSWVIAVMRQVEAGAKSRTFGTLGYAVTMLALGQVIVRVGYQVMPVFAMSFLAVAFAVAWTQPEARLEIRATAEETPNRANPRALLSNPVYVLLVVVMFFTGMAVGPINNMKVVVFESVGGDVSFLGWDSFIGCMIQLPFLIFSGQLRRLKAVYRMAAGAFAGLMYALIVFLAGNPALRTTAHSVVDVAYGSVSNMIASAWSGAVLDWAGKQVMSGICILFAGIALAFSAAILRLEKRSAQA